MSGASLSHLLPPLPGLTALARTYAPWPVWSGSVAKPIRFAALPKKAAVRLWHRARDFDRSTHQPGHHGGALGHTALQVLHSLIFDFLNHRTGRLDPSYAAIAAKAGVCVRTVASALARLRELGILNWVRRCAESWQDGRFVLAQETNAYAVLPESQWRGYRAPPEPPAPWPGTWGDPAPMLPSLLAQAALEGDLAGKVQVLEANAMTPLERALASLGRALAGRDS
jgi:Helix-turn-helix domain